MCIRDRFRAHTDQETGQTIIAGMGELHLEIIVDRLLREFKVEANVGAPQVAYKEAFTKPVDVDSKYAKQSGGRGQYGHCKVKFEPMDVNGEETFKFESSVVGGAIPKEYIPAVGEGIEEAMQSGILGGFPVVGLKANVYDGSYHEVDSSEMAFHIAGSLAFKDAMKKASPVLLEPMFLCPFASFVLVFRRSLVIRRLKFGRSVVIFTQGEIFLSFCPSALHSW